MLFTFLLIVQTLVAAAMIIVILMQRSEGGGLTGGSPSGLMTARGAADFLTRSTAILGGLFVFLSIALAAYAGVQREPAKVDTSLANQVAPATPVAPQPGTAPLAQPGAQPPAAPAQNQSEPAVPLAQ